MIKPTIMLAILWTATIGYAPEAGYSSPTVSGNRVCITGNLDDGSTVFCLDAETGETLWLGESTGNVAGYGSPILFEYENIPLTAAMDAKGLFAVNRSTGKLQFHVWHPARLDENITTPIYHDGKNLGNCLRFGLKMIKYCRCHVLWRARNWTSFSPGGGRGRPCDDCSEIPILSSTRETISAKYRDA